jgi:hypothetical protein
VVPGTGIHLEQGMKERPILFSGAMVRALLDGSKTQTRRALRIQPLDILPMESDKAGREWVGLMTRDPKPQGTTFRCKFGVPGDRLYVRETWAQPAALDPGPTVYRADYPACVPAGFANIPAVDEITWKPSIHMPRALSRIMLEIASVRVERLQDISEADAIAEGIERHPEYPTMWKRGPLHGDQNTVTNTAFPRLAYRSIWEQINGHESWAGNPWVWVVEFKVIGNGKEAT